MKISDNNKCSINRNPMSNITNKHIDPVVLTNFYVFFLIFTWQVNLILLSSSSYKFVKDWRYTHMVNDNIINSSLSLSLFGRKHQDPDIFTKKFSFSKKNLNSFLFFITLTCVKQQPACICCQKLDFLLLLWFDKWHFQDLSISTSLVFGSVRFISSNKKKSRQILKFFIFLLVIVVICFITLLLLFWLLYYFKGRQASQSKKYESHFLNRYCPFFLFLLYMISLFEGKEIVNFFRNSLFVYFCCCWWWWWNWDILRS